MASRLEDYAMIGDGRTAALVARNGAIDWLCLPRFDSDPCCVALLGNEQRGHWQIAPCGGGAAAQRRYRDDTLVLQSEFVDGGNRVRLTDFMAVGTEHPTVVRQVEGLSGRMRLRCELVLRFDFGLVTPRFRRHADAVVAIVGPDLVALRGPMPLQPDAQGNVAAEFDIAAGQQLAFTLAHAASHHPPPAALDVGQALRTTLAFWQDWAAQFRIETPWRDAVVRSLLTLKALTYHPTGSMVAAATAGLPEQAGGTLNWDYRYCWLRDASFTMCALLNAGYRAEALAWRDWMLRAIAAAPDKMRIMYRVDGGRRLNEWEVKWLSGYEGAAPVIAGNSAADQEQIDVAGELLDAMHLMVCAGLEQTAETLDAERQMLRQLEATWQDKGHGPWESRGRPQHYTYGKVMAWVGVDRFLRHHTSDVDAEMLARLRELRRRMHDQIMTHSWNFARGHLVDRYGGSQPDASLLLLPLVNFLPADEPRMAATIDAVERALSEDGLVWRTPAGTDGGQGAFIPCSCWLADCRALQGRRDDAVRLLERVLSLRNDVGLLSEEYHPGMRRLMGNFPQALSHVAVVNTALGLSGPVLQRGGG